MLNAEHRLNNGEDCKKYQVPSTKQGLALRNVYCLKQVEYLLLDTRDLLILAPCTWYFVQKNPHFD